jgi:hypothetical protein
MKIPINLASQPFRRDRALLIASVAVSVLLLLTLGGLISLAMTDRVQLADLRGELSHLRAQINAVTKEQQQYDAVLRKPENAEVLERSLFLNTLIDRKAISWTKIFADLEKVMPYNVRLVSVRLPAVDSNNQVLLDMVVGAKDVQPILELLKRLEGSPQFGPSSVQTSTPPSQTDPFFRYHVTVSYAQKL